MTTVVICKGCDALLEQYTDAEPYVEKYDVCDRCARDAHEAEFEAAQDALSEEFWG